MFVGFKVCKWCTLPKTQIIVCAFYIDHLRHFSLTDILSFTLKILYIASKILYLKDLIWMKEFITLFSALGKLTHHMRFSHEVSASLKLPTVKSSNAVTLHALLNSHGSKDMRKFTTHKNMSWVRSRGAPWVFETHFWTFRFIRFIISSNFETKAIFSIILVSDFAKHTELSIWVSKLSILDVIFIHFVHFKLNIFLCYVLQICWSVILISCPMNHVHYRLTSIFL